MFSMWFFRLSVWTPIPQLPAAEPKSVTGLGEVFASLLLPYLSTCCITDKHRGLAISLSLIQPYLLTSYSVCFSLSVVYVLLALSKFPTWCQSIPRVNWWYFPAWKGAATLQIRVKQYQDDLVQIQFMHFFLVRFGLSHTSVLSRGVWGRSCK